MKFTNSVGLALVVSLTIFSGTAFPAMALGIVLGSSQIDENVDVVKARQNEGLLHIRKAIEIDPENDEYYVKLGHISNDRGDSITAIAAYKTAINLKFKPNRRSSFNRAMRYERISDYLREQGDLSGAVAAHDKAAAILCAVERSCPSRTEGTPKAVAATPKSTLRSMSRSAPFKGRDRLRDRLRRSPSSQIKTTSSF
jgi:hypothetical protein